MKNKLLKSVCALLLAVTVFCTGLCLQVFAQPSEALYEYSVYDGGITITKYNGNETELVIPQEIDGYPVQYLNANWLPENVAENVTSITLPASLIMLYDGALPLMPKLVGISVEAGNPFYFSDNSVLFDTRDDITVLVCYPSAKTDTAYTVPDGVQIVDGFRGNPYLQTVLLPDGVQTILYGAFSDCTALTQIKFPRSLKTVMSYAFFNCTALSTVWFSNRTYTGIGSSTSIGSYAFGGCTALKDVFMPNDAYDFGENSFPDNQNLVLYGNAKSGATWTVKDYAVANGHTFQDIHIQMQYAYENKNGSLFCAYDKAPIYLFTEYLSDRYAYYAPITLTVTDANGQVLTNLQAPITDGVTFRLESSELKYDLYYTYSEAKLGDVNCDGKINAIDARYVLQASSGARTFTDAECRLADVNGDGKVNAIDARRILQIASGAYPMY